MAGSFTRVEPTISVSRASRGNVSGGVSGSLNGGASLGNKPRTAVKTPLWARRFGFWAPGDIASVTCISSRVISVANTSFANAQTPTWLTRSGEGFWIQGAAFAAAKYAAQSGLEVQSSSRVQTP